MSKVLKSLQEEDQVEEMARPPLWRVLEENFLKRRWWYPLAVCVVQACWLLLLLPAHTLQTLYVLTVSGVPVLYLIKTPSPEWLPQPVRLK